MRAIRDLETMGYTFTLDGGAIRFTHEGERPDLARVRPLLEYIKRHKAEAMYFIGERFEVEATALLSHCDNSLGWAHRWADLHDRWGIPCFGFGSWADWARDVAEGG